MEREYTQELLEELMQWAEERLVKKDLPKGSYQFTRTDKILDCEFYVKKAISMMKSNWRNPFFRPIVDDFCAFKEHIEGLEKQS